MSEKHQPIYTIEDISSLNLEKFTFVDVRPHTHLLHFDSMPNAIKLDFEYIHEELKKEKWQKRKEDALVVYSTGEIGDHRAEKAVAILAHNGFSKVGLFDGGILAWHGISSEKVIVRQLFDRSSFTYTYILADPVSREALLIDCVEGHVKRDLGELKAMGLKLKYIIETHIHSDHITGSHKIHKTMKTPVKHIIGEKADVAAHARLIRVVDGDKIHFGKHFLTVVETPGHTDGCCCYVLDDRSMVFTGDTLLNRGVGRVDYQGGNATRLYESVQSKLFQTLPEHCVVYPAHDYSGRTWTTIGEQKKFNDRVSTKVSLEEFREHMRSLDLGRPKLMDDAIPT
eukprot:CAMPEP_0117443510 /NCGR_PEP_ID=MMETSP0759-20121206/4731_1 /TAXON_ID=63605 /ORGANISM="Percolomonas cosmopolitus, Strain WS" /LENGTH=340 /DNA_ID=CAMNT_0005235485 /DNA_START=160 /DNA_END=1179 /DNA_ORIENTATION=-